MKKADNQRQPEAGEGTQELFPTGGPAPAALVSMRGGAKVFGTGVLCLSCS